MSLLDRAIVRTLPAVPKPVVKRLSSRYIAGAELRDAVRVVRQLNNAGKMATLDVLGEEVTTENEALMLVDEYMAVFDAIRREGLDSNVSVKPTGLGLTIDRELFHENLVQLVRCAEERSNFVRIDMEDSSTTSDTLAVYRTLREEGLSSVGVVLQARLRRTVGDVRELADLQPSVRVCKGIYLEPAEIAYQGADTIRENFVDVLDELLAAGAYVGIATHDEWVIERAKELVARYGLGRRRLRVPDAARGRRAARRRARTSRAQTSDLRPVRAAVVRVLAASPPGEPGHGRRDREADGRPVRAWTERRVIWAEAEGCRVVDGDGRRLLDLSGGFGVAALGHRSPEVWAAVDAQAARCVHALGDLAEADVTAELRRRLGLGGHEVKLGVTGEDAVELALRTALLVTGRPGIVAFEGAYHGTGLLALAATGFERFREPFRAWLPGPVHRFAYGKDPGPLPPDAGCVIVEPVQGRAGARVPPAEFLETLRERCDEAGRALHRGRGLLAGWGEPGRSGRAAGLQMFS